MREALSKWFVSLAVASLGGVLFMVGHLYWWPCSVLGFALLGLAMERKTPLACAALGMVQGCTAYGLGMSWAWGSLRLATESGVLATGATAVLVTTIYAATSSVVGLLYAFGRGFGWSAPLSLTVAVLGAEMLVPGPFPVYLGYCLIEVEPLNQLAAFGGPLALSAVCAAVAGTLVVLSDWKRTDAAGRVVKPVVWGLAGITTLALIELWSPVRSSGEPLSVRLVHLGEPAPRRSPGDVRGSIRFESISA